VAINSFAVPILRYSASLVEWTQAELYKLDVTTRKLLSLHRAFNINSDVDRLYVHRSLGGRGLLSIADTVQRERNNLGYYLTQSSEPILHLISEGLQVSHSGRAYVCVDMEGFTWPLF